MRVLPALFLGLWASVANADFYTGVLQQQAQQVAAPSVPAVGDIGTPYTTYGTGGSLDMPDNIANGNRLLAFVGTSNASDSAVSGWTLEDTCTNVNWASTVKVFSHVVTDAGSEPASVTLTTSTSAIQAFIVRVTDVTEIGPTAVFSDGSTLTTNHVTPNITPASTPGIVFGAASGYQSSAFTWGADPETALHSANGTSASTNMPFIVNYKATSGTSSQGTMTFTSVESRASCMLSIVVSQ